MKKMKWIGMVIGIVAVLFGAGLFCFRDKIKMLYISLQSFKDENLAHTFQHTQEIQPVKKIARGDKVFQFQREENIALANGFTF